MELASCYVRTPHQGEIQACTLQLSLNGTLVPVGGGKEKWEAVILSDRASV